VTIRPTTAGGFAGAVGNLSQVPEPGTWALLAAAAACLLPLLRRVATSKNLKPSGPPSL